MRLQVILLFAIVLVSLAAFGCGGGTTSPNLNGGNVNTAGGNTNNPLQTTTRTPEPTTNNAPTLTPIVKAYCAAMVKNDEAAIRKIYSSDTIKDFEKQMKDEKIKSLVKFLEDDKMSGTPCEATNEKINGDTALVTIITDKYPKGLEVKFIKENGEWKLTNSVPDLDAVKRSAANANSAK
jgi:hypothetical protein